LAHLDGHFVETTAVTFGVTYKFFENTWSAGHVRRFYFIGDFSLLVTFNFE